MCLGGGKARKPEVRDDEKEQKRPDTGLNVSSDISLGEQIRRSAEPCILIIGAGAAGIACATKLLDYGFKDVHILEAEKRIGGRIHTVDFADNRVDLGAQWVHGEVNNAVYQLVHHHHMVETSGDLYVTFDCVRTSGEVVAKSKVDRLMEILVEIFEKIHETRTFEGSFAEFLHVKFFQRFRNPKYSDIDQILAREFLQNFIKVEMCETAVSLDEVSARTYTEYWQCEGDHLLNWKDKGYIEFLRLLMNSKRVGKELGVLDGRISFGRTVDKIKWGQSDAIIEVQVKETDVPVLADHVIVTVSLGVLKKNCERLFLPSLPMEKRNAIYGIGFGSVVKILIEFPIRFWAESWTGVSILWREEDLVKIRKGPDAWVEDVVGFYCYNHQPKVLIAWVVGRRTKYIESLSTNDMKTHLMALLARVMPRYMIPKPVGILRSEWTSNEHFLGAYSFRSLKSDALNVYHADLIAPLTVLTYAPHIDHHTASTASSYPLSLKPVVMFAGEATSEHYFSTVHGAVQSGWREADRLDGFYAKSLDNK